MVGRLRAYSGAESSKLGHDLPYFVREHSSELEQVPLSAVTPVLRQFRIRDRPLCGYASVIGESNGERDTREPIDENGPEVLVVDNECPGPVEPSPAYYGLLITYPMRKAILSGRSAVQ